MEGFIGFFSNILGYLLEIIYELVKNYGLAIILFSVLLKIILLPFTIKQQKTIKKTQKVQEEMKKIQDKYSNNPEKMNQEIMDLYKKENLSPFSGCFSSIIQMILLFAMFYLVRSPLTYMKKISVEDINNYKEKIIAEQGENNINAAYPEISIVKYVNNKEIKDEEKNFYINMKFLGSDLSDIPKENYKDIKVYIIPLLYIISSFISIKITQASQEKINKLENEEEDKKLEEQDMTNQMNKSMMWMMPILAVSVSMIAPLGLALYWLVNNVLMIIERIIIDKVVEPKEDKKMAKKVIAEGKTTTQAIENGLKKLNVSKDDVEVKILDEDKKRSFYSILAPRIVKVELTVKEKTEVNEKKDKKVNVNKNLNEIEEAKKTIENFLEVFLKNKYKYEIKIDEFNINVDIEGENVSCLIGYRGETINAIQTILTAIANKNSSSRIRVFVDVAGYKQKRIKTLEDLAEKISKTVIKTGKAITLEPMTAYERKIIHTKLQENDKIQTFSKGEEPHRRVVIALSK